MRPFLPLVLVSALLLAQMPAHADEQFSSSSGVLSIGGKRGNIAVLPPSALPAPTSSTLGGVMAGSAPTHQFQTGVGTDGVPTFAIPAATDIAGLAPSAMVDTTNAGNITSGSLAVSRGGTGSTTLPTGIVIGNGNTLSAATAGSDYVAPTGSGAGLTGITPSQVGAVSKAGDNFGAGTLGFPVNAPIDLTFARMLTSAGSFMKLGAGNAISVNPALSGISASSDSPNTPDPTFFDHQRCSFCLSAVTLDDGHSEEQTIGVFTTIRTGAKKVYAANTAYNFGDNIAIGNAVYRAVSGSAGNTAGTTGANSAPQGTRPTTSQTGNYTVVDGTVMWKWINDAAINAKLGLYAETNVIAGNGFAEGVTFNFDLRPGSDPRQGATGHEEDCKNDSGTDGAVGVNALCHWIAIGGSNKWLTGLLISGNNGSSNSKWGVRLAGGLATDCALCIDDNNAASGGAALGANYGVQIGGLFGEAVSHGTADYYTSATTPNGFLDQGIHSYAAISLAGSGGYGLSIVGTGYTTALISANNFTLLPSGALNLGFGATIIAPTSGSSVTLKSANNATSAMLFVDSGPSGQSWNMGPGSGTATASFNIYNASLGTVPFSLAPSGNLKLPGLATSAGTTKGTVCADTTGAIYVKTTTGACL